jgi:hypothetical protein
MCGALAIAASWALLASSLPAAAREAPTPTLKGVSYDEQVQRLGHRPSGAPRNDDVPDPSMFTDDALKGMAKCVGCSGGGGGGAGEAALLHGPRWSRLGRRGGWGEVWQVVYRLARQVACAAGCPAAACLLHRRLRRYTRYVEQLQEQGVEEEPGCEDCRANRELVEKVWQVRGRRPRRRCCAALLPLFGSWRTLRPLCNPAAYRQQGAASPGLVSLPLPHCPCLTAPPPHCPTAPPPHRPTPHTAARPRWWPTSTTTPRTASPRRTGAGSCRRCCRRTAARCARDRRRTRPRAS